MADNLVLGRGKVFFAPYAHNQTTGGIKGYFGNTPQMTLTQTNTKLDHYSSEGGLKIKDKSILLQSDMNITFDCDNISYGNLTLWFGGNNVEAAPSDAPTDIGTLTLVGSADAVYGALFYESDNPVGDNKNMWWPYVMLSPNGNLALKGDAWQTLSFTAEALKRDTATERVYVYAPAGGASTAAADTLTPEFTVNTAMVSDAVIASAATVVASGAEVHLVPFPVTWTLDGGTAGDRVAYMFINNGTVDLGSMVELVGQSGTSDITIASAGTVHVEVYQNPQGTGTRLAVSTGSIVAT